RGMKQNGGEAADKKDLGSDVLLRSYSAIWAPRLAARERYSCLVGREVLGQQRRHFLPGEGLVEKAG
nr:hypothetical protein [Tanacetum cinerariifolium]